MGSLTHENPSPAPPELVKFAFYFRIYSMYAMLFSEHLALVSPKHIALSRTFAHTPGEHLEVYFWDMCNKHHWTG